MQAVLRLALDCWLEPRGAYQVNSSVQRLPFLAILGGCHGLWLGRLLTVNLCVKQDGHLKSTTGAQAN